MGTVPSKNVDKIQFYEDHIARFTTNAVAIGTTVADVTDLTSKTIAARAAYTTQQLALSEAKDKTLACHNAVQAMGVKGAAIIKQVRAKGESTGNPNVYVLAGIPAPATPSSRPVPGTPFDYKVELEPNGTLVSTWKCNNPAGTTGTMYQVFRRIGGAGEFVYLGGNGAKTFTDDTIPANATQLTYQIQAVRSTSVGVFAEFNVNFGTNAGGGTFATFSESPNAKLAA